MSENGFFLSIGKQGSGKTLFITKLLKDNYNGQNVFSNYKLFGIPYQPITLSDRDNLPDNYMRVLDVLDKDPNIFNNSIMLLDEIHLDLNSLDFMRENNRRLQTFFSQLRKRNILLLGTSQYIMNVDIRIRRQCKNVFEMTNIKDGIFMVVTHDIDGYYTKELSRAFFNLTEYYQYYDTNEIIF